MRRRRPWFSLALRELRHSGRGGDGSGRGCRLADSTALPEIGGEAGWYFSPLAEDAITATLRELLDQPEERSRRLALGKEIAEHFRWQRSNDLLIERS